ncbi:MAG: flavodoxin [Methanobrevibacter sp.]|nr:flavodoxin [Methanobrevibacter sp.]
MNTLIVYYSRTKNTQNVAKNLKEKLHADIEEIIDTKNRSGVIGWISSCIDAIRKVPVKIKPIEKDPAIYDTVIIGTPVWASTMANPVLTYITENKEKFKDVAFFCTCRHGGYEETFANMKEIIAKKPLETLFLTELDMESFDDKLESYANKIKGN